jgi:putative peptide zinc metalloprotease protein
MNANPLIKLDGYFVLAEYLDISELRDDAFRYAGYLIRRYILRIPVECPAIGRARKRILVVYAVLSFWYSATILTIFYLWARGMLIGWLAFAGALGSTYVFYLFFRKAFGHTANTAKLWVLTHKERLARTRWAWGLGVGALLAALFFVPYAGTLKRSVTLEPGRVAMLTAPEELFLLDARFAGGEPVRTGDTLAVLDAREYSVGAAGLEKQSLAREREAWAAQSAGSLSDAASADAMGRGLADEARAFRDRAAHAVLRAPFDGRVLTLSQLDHVGERMEAGETLCVVGDMRTLRASFSLPEQDVVDMRPGAPARARLVANGAVLRGRISQVEWEPIDTKSGRQYRVWLTLAGREGVKAGQSAIARISTPPRSAAGHFVRWLTRWLRTDLLV